MYVILNMLNTRPENKSSVRDKGFTILYSCWFSGVNSARGSSPCLESSRSSASRFMIFPVSFLTVSANDCNDKNGYSS